MHFQSLNFSNMKLKIIFLTTVLIINSIGLTFSQEFSFLIETSEFNKGKTEAKEKNMIYYGMNGDKVVIQPLGDDQADTRIIFNRTERTMIILNDDSDSKMAMKMTMPKSEETEYDYDEFETDDIDVPNLKKTGKTEKINNYLCHQFIATDDDGTVELWMTTDLPVSFYQLMDFYGMNSGPGKQKSESSSEFLPFEFRKYGFPIKIINTDTDGSKTIMLFNNISKTVDLKKFDTAGFEIQDMSKFQFNYKSK